MLTCRDADVSHRHILSSAEIVVFDLKYSRLFDLKDAETHERCAGPLEYDPQIDRKRTRCPFVDVCV